MKQLGRVLLAIGIGLACVVMEPSQLAVWGQTNNSQTQQAQKLLELAIEQANKGQPQKAIATLEQALLLAQQQKDRKLEAVILAWIGFNYRNIGQPKLALDYYNQSLPITKEVGDRTGEASTLSNIGLVYANIGQPKLALDYYNQSLLIRKQVGDRAGEAKTLNNIGTVYADIGQPKLALDYYNQSLPIRKEVGDRAGEAKTLNNIGFVYADIGEPNKALDYFNQSLPITKEVGDRASEATTLSNIGTVYADIGQPNKALDYHNQSLPITKEVGDRAGEATTLNNIGFVYTNIGQPKLALDYYNQSLLITKEVGDRAGEATTLNNIGFVYAYIEQPKLALDYYNQSLLIRKQVGDRAGEATTLNNIGTIYAYIEQPKLALDYYNQSLLIRKQVGDRAGEATTLNNIGFVYADIGKPDKAVEHFKQSLTRILEIRANITKDERIKFLQLQQDTRNALINILIKLHQNKDAYEWANFVTTVDLVDYTRLIDAKVKDPASQKAINEWNQLNQQLQLLRQNLQQQFSEPLSGQMRELEAQVFKKSEEISQRFPEVAEIFETTPTDISRLQANIPTGTTLIHPVVLTDTKNAPNTIALFVLTKNSLTVKQVSVPKQFYKLVKQTYEQLTNRLKYEYLDNLESLYNLLIAPVESEIQATKPQQLGFIASGALRYIPFDTLYDSKNNQFLLEKYPVSYLTRLSTRSFQSPKTNPSPAQKRVLAFGNPSPNGLLALTNAEIEVKKIADTLPGSKFFTGDKATLDSFKILAPQFPLLHLATHGCFQRGGCLKLKLEENVLVFADEKLKIADAARLGLENVDLITLSACQTALQTDNSGEPIIDDNEASITGLAYLFERAGAKAVIGNLWSIDDKATRDIMVEFYQNLNQGKSKTQALREAKLTQIQRHPFFWSSFVLIGDPN
ncbi:CHAT domain-containing protein [Nostoc edaphicum CCNP1411]|uniref:CHAT domain-containing protein n=1 Tax=Nostoc edaphicum CCNP1411 TaxID=1472755 RepID=A0A7D7LFW9_9NOSO|nr:CHAT domain-containing tetratricopeptide repeat protein [Nostoc edaphicum]QMS89612.1 CHAT domain-containing protein [Nostoc edaphicum CCNP1411]